MSGVTSVNQLLKLDVQAKENHNVYSKIDAWFRAEKELKSAVDPQTKKKLTDKDVMQFTLECKEFFGGNCEEDNGEITPEVCCGTEFVVLRSKRNGSYCEGGKSEEV